VLFVLALLVIVSVFVLLWKLREGPGGGRPPRPGGDSPVRPRPRRPIRSVGPDDDPEFLRELSRRMRRDQSDT
jgi:hypothetical protein